MNILNKRKSNGVLLGLGLGAAVSLVWCRSATAEVKVFEADGWSFTFGGRVNAFLSGGKGDAFPRPTPDPTGAMHLVMGAFATGPGAGVSDVGFLSYNQDANYNYTAVRVRSGMFPNVLAFGVNRSMSERTTIRGYVSIWATVETLGRDKWAPVIAEAREGYFTVDSYWGSLTAGRSLGWLGRTSYEIDAAYGHGYGLGLPCTDALGPGCGHIGTGELFPGYSAGLSYSTPSLRGLQLHAGIYDPIVFVPSTTGNDWSRASFVRPEGSLTFDTPLGASGKLKLGVEGLYQSLERTGTNAAGGAINVTSSIWGVSGGARVEVGPLRLGGSAFRGRGIGLGYAGQRSVAISDNDPTAASATGVTYNLRTFTGFYGQAALVSGPFQVGAGYGQGIVDQLAVDKVNPNLSVIHTQTGISASLYYHVSDSVVLGADYFMFTASWYGAPRVDANNLPTGAKLAGERQVLNFLNAGVTYHW